MRYGIFSDVHSNLEALQAVAAAYKKESIDTYLCAGDVIGYAANPKECIEMAGSLARTTVGGNHDWAAVSLFSLEYFNPQARQAIHWTKQNIDEKERQFLKALPLTFENEDLTLVHGTLLNPQDFDYLADEYAAEDTFSLLKTKVVFIGHTHHAGIFIQDKTGALRYQQEPAVRILPENKYIVNVGSVGQPRDGDPQAAYCVYDTEKFEVRIQRVEYDKEMSRKKILEAGLPAFLGDRLFEGK